MTEITNNKTTKKFIRINSIRQVLKNNPHSIKLSELAIQFNVSEKTIQRDLEELKAHGLKKVGNGWTIIEKEISNEYKDLILGMLDVMAKSTEDGFYKKVHSFFNQIEQQLDNSIFLSIDNKSFEEENINVYEKINKAIKKKQYVNFIFNNKKRLIKPLKSYFYEGEWYLFSYEIQDEVENFKTFSLKGMTDIELVEKKFFSIEDSIKDKLKYANSPWFKISDSFIATLYIAANTTKYFKRKPFKRQRIIEENPDGSITIEVVISHEMEIIPRIYWHLPNIVVLGPTQMVDKINQVLVNYLKKSN